MESALRSTRVEFIFQINVVPHGFPSSDDDEEFNIKGKFENSDISTPVQIPAEAKNDDDDDHDVSTNDNILEDVELQNFDQHEDEPIPAKPQQVSPPNLSSAMSTSRDSSSVEVASSNHNNFNNAQLHSTGSHSSTDLRSFSNQPMSKSG